MIKALSLAKLVEKTKGRLVGDDALFEAVSTDSRTMKAGDVFVAIRGENFDGHEHVRGANDQQALAVVVDHEGDLSCPQVVVDDTRSALGMIGLMNRESFSGDVIGITGSSGKTTVKNMLSSILSNIAETHATKGNFNNEIGVPQTLIALEAKHRFAVVEMGARAVGDIRYLGEFVKPNIAVLLNVGSAHIDVFGGYENMVEAKSEIFETLGEEGIAIFNADDPAASRWEKQNSARPSLRFGIEAKGCDVTAKEIEYRDNGSSFTLQAGEVTQAVSLTMPGKHNVLNALAAASVATALQVSVAVICEGLKQAGNDSGRLEEVLLAQGEKLIDDSYNANPASMKSALDVLSLANGRRFAVMGDMAELGEYAEGLYRELAQYALESNIEEFHVVGRYGHILEEVLNERCTCYASKEQLAESLVNRVKPGDTILVKGSRSAGMEDVVALIREARG